MRHRRARRARPRAARAGARRRRSSRDRASCSQRPRPPTPRSPRRRSPGQVTQTVAQAPAPTSTARTPAPTPTTPPATPGGHPVDDHAGAPQPPPNRRKSRSRRVPPVAKPSRRPRRRTRPRPRRRPSRRARLRAAKRRPLEPAILLDTNAACTYNPAHLPEASFGDPSLAIDGDTATGWTAEVEPATAPNMTDGLLIDLRDTQRLSAAELVTATPGLTVQVFGSPADTAPPTITDPGGPPLSMSEVIKTRHARSRSATRARAFASSCCGSARLRRQPSARRKRPGA